MVLVIFSFAVHRSLQVLQVEPAKCWWNDLSFHAPGEYRISESEIFISHPLWIIIVTYKSLIIIHALMIYH